MSKTPEELTWDWKAGKLEYGRYWVKNKVWEKPFIDRWRPNCSWEISCKDAIEQILAPVPTYDEYKTMQDELAEFKRTVTSYVGKPIDYDIACETVNKLLDVKEQLKKELESARWYQTAQNEDISKLRGLLKECLAHLSLGEIGTSVTPLNILLTRINAALGDMLKNPENFNTPDENVKGDDR